MPEFDRYGRPIIDPKEILESLDPKDSSWYTRTTRSQARQKSPRRETSKLNSRKQPNDRRNSSSSNPGTERAEKNSASTATAGNERLENPFRIESQNRPIETRPPQAPKPSVSVEKSARTAERRKRPREEESQSTRGKPSVKLTTEAKLRKEVKLLKEITLATNNYIQFLLKERNANRNSPGVLSGFFNPFTSMQVAEKNSRPQAPSTVSRSEDRSETEPQNEKQTSSSSSRSNSNSNSNEKESRLFVDIEDVSMARHNLSSGPQPALEFTSNSTESPVDSDTSAVLVSNPSNADSQSRVSGESEISSNASAPVSQVPSTAESSVAVPESSGKSVESVTSSPFLEPTSPGFSLPKSSQVHDVIQEPVPVQESVHIQEQVPHQEQVIVEEQVNLQEPVTVQEPVVAQEAIVVNASAAEKESVVEKESEAEKESVSEQEVHAPQGNQVIEIPLILNQPPEADTQPVTTLVVIPKSSEFPQNGISNTQESATPFELSDSNKQIIPLRNLRVNLPTGDNSQPIIVSFATNSRKQYSSEKGALPISPQISTYSGKTASKSPRSSSEYQNSINSNVAHRKSSAEVHCSICAIPLSSETDLLTHLKSHLESSQYKCETCNKRFASKTSFYEHQQVHQEPAFKCSVCKIEVSSKVGLIEHSKTHVEENQHQCSVCSLRVESRTALISHLKTHVGEKVYSCNSCGIKVAMDRWDEHTRYHLRSSGAN